MLLGTYQGILSSKRRVAVPSSFRKLLGDKFIVAKWYEGCLVLVESSKFGALLEKLKGETKVITRGIRDTERFILGSAFELATDDQGRVVIPSSLTGYAGLSQEISFIGLGDRVEVWDSKSWQKREKMVAQSAPETLEKLANEK
jgi:MraZ protein